MAGCQLGDRVSVGAGTALGTVISLAPQRGEVTVLLDSGMPTVVNALMVRSLPPIYAGLTPAQQAELHQSFQTQLANERAAAAARTPWWRRR